jgi:hypothetical protein
MFLYYNQSDRPLERRNIEEFDGTSLCKRTKKIAEKKYEKTIGVHSWEE